jgi:hypothetical protein
MSKFGYATEEALWADAKDKGVEGTIEAFRDFLQGMGCKEVILDGARCLFLLLSRGTPYLT